MSEEKLSVGRHEEERTPVDQLTVSRRWLLLKVGALFNAVVGVAIAVPVVKYLLSPVKSDDAYKSWVPLGSVDTFPVGETRLAKFTNPVSRAWDGETDRVACWVRRVSEKEFKVFAINCAHLGCPVRWFPQSGLFMCPCHGGAYYADGTRASGPPERGLFTYETKIVDGALQINAGQMPTLSNSAKLAQIENAQGASPCAG
ncbi:MAG TPA: Rieske (2Fe-2S) protein [Edaphobacter sp.]|nr:Rieske (2Fe-2S) protein [Edaphobacter sp.]